MPLNARYRHTNLIAHDWQRLASFYERVSSARACRPSATCRASGSNVGRESPAPACAGCTSDCRRSARTVGPTLEIFSYDTTIAQPLPVANRAGFGHVAFEVDDVRSAVREVVDAGGARVGDIVVREVQGAGSLTFAYVRDPEGNILEFQSWS